MTRSRSAASCWALIALSATTVLHAAANRPARGAAMPRGRALQSLALQACGASDAAIEFTVDGQDTARLWCPSVERVANNAVRLRSACNRQGRQWHCALAGKEFSLPVNGHPVNVLYPVGLDSFAAWQMARAIVPMTVPLAPDSGPASAEHCRLSGDFSDLKVARMTLRCQDWTVEFVRLCDANGCRHVPASRISNADPMNRGQRLPRAPQR